MYCHECGQLNELGQRLCKSCDIELLQKCKGCDFLNQAASKFCGGCGKEILQLSSSSVEAERRQLTVMFCDLVGSTELAEKFDPEELRDLLKTFQKAVASVVQKFDGYIAKYIGDGLLIYFGYPKAHEDDARRSILAGLEIIKQIEALNVKKQSSLDVELGVRIGIHTGLVVIGQMGSGKTREENAIVGKTPNIAARIESVATPNTVAVSGDTHELTSGLFVTEERVFQALKGVSEVITIFDVISKSTFLSDFDVRTQKGLTPLVGRTKELGFLKQSWEQTKEGTGQVVWLSGEAGVGKSRIVNEFMSHASFSPKNLRLYYCSSVFSHSAFYPIMSHLKRLANIKKDESDEAKYKHLKEFLESRALHLGQVASLLAPFLGIKLTEEIKDTIPDKAKKMIIESWLGLMAKMAEENPLLLVFEDMHWVDPSTQELINLLMQSLASHRILLLITSRPSYQLPIDSKVALQSLTINRLDSAASSQIIQHLAGYRDFPVELVEDLVAKADGVPLFLEELTRTVLDSQILKKREDSYELSAPLSTLAIPSSLQDSLTARLDKLSGVKNIAQIAATIGRSFSIDLLVSISAYSKEEVEAAVESLLKVRLIYKSNASNTDRYHFSHVLLQETAYQSLLKTTRKHYHGLIAESILKNFPRMAESEPEILALHCTKAGKTEQAVSFWLAAGEKACKTSSHREAITHLNQGIELLNMLPESEERTILEFQIQVRLIVPLISFKGYTSSEVEKTFNRALALSKIVDISHEIFPVLHSRYSFYQVCGMIRKANILQEELFELAKHQKKPFIELPLVGYRMRGTSQFLSGQSKLAEKSLKYSIEAYNFEKHRNLYLLYGHDTKVAALSYQALSSWHQGKVNAALAYGEEAINLADQIGNGNTIGVSYSIGNIAPLALLDEVEKVFQYAKIQIEISKSGQMPLWHVSGLMFKGWAMVLLGQHEEGMELLEDSLSTFDKMKVGQFHSLIALLYAQACKITKRVVKGIAKLEEALQQSSLGGECWLDAEIHRYLGELYLVKPNPDPKQALEEFFIALDIARQQSSKTQELNVAISLYKLTDNGVDKVKVEQQLKDICLQFDNEPTFKALLQAKELLETSNASKFSAK